MLHWLLRNGTHVERKWTYKCIKQNDKSIPLVRSASTVFCSSDSTHRLMADTLLNSSGGSDNGGYETAPEPEVENTTLAIADPQPADIQIDFGLQSQELFVFRWTLRFLSLWCPASACLAEKTFYPALVNILLLLMIASDFNVDGKRSMEIN